MNNVVLIGRVAMKPVGNPEKTMCRFQLAFDDWDKKKGKSTWFIRVEAFNSDAKFAIDLVEQGQTIAVSGKLVKDQYFSKKANKDVDTFKIYATHLEGFKNKNDEQLIQEEKAYARNTSDKAVEEEEDLPF